MEDAFQKMVQQYEPMIFHLLKKFQVRDQDQEFYQELLITLWQASVDYQPEKGKFSTFVYYKMQYRLIDLIRKAGREQQLKHLMLREYHHESIYHEHSYDHDYLMLKQIRALLTAREWRWFKGQILEGKSMTQISREYQVKPNAVRHWKRKSITKIKRLLNISIKQI
ncbi:sigma-70 family RNA polymerase sigma factor [Amphibacillus sediminis]|uniref:sigma-70 family RNA polymerase sigma factor n=1 Tax=Amphibacillus sediminis TaxID=360185 RepID=UPI00082C9D39|nr:sigma-70 family RNA polymerase sigma factor [Amphibacillus sediminis]